MEHWVGLSAQNIVTQYFFSENNQLVFVHSKKYQTVDQSGYMLKPQFSSELRCYYEKNKLIKTVGKSINNEKKR